MVSQHWYGQWLHTKRTEITGDHSPNVWHVTNDMFEMYFIVRNGWIFILIKHASILGCEFGLVDMGDAMYVTHIKRTPYQLHSFEESLGENIPAGSNDATSQSALKIVCTSHQHNWGQLRKMFQVVVCTVYIINQQLFNIMHANDYGSTA